MFRAALIGVLLAGCSFVGVTPVPSAPRSEPLACTDTYGWPVVDTIGAIGVGALAGYTSYALGGLQHDCGSGNCKTDGERARGGLLAGVVLSLPWTSDPDRCCRNPDCAGCRSCGGDRGSGLKS